MLDWVIKFVPNTLVTKVLASAIRKILIALGTLLAASLYPEVAEIGALLLAHMDTVVAKALAVLTILVSLVWGWIEKKQKAK